MTCMDFFCFSQIKELKKLVNFTFDPKIADLTPFRAENNFSVLAILLVIKWLKNIVLGQKVESGNLFSPTPTNNFSILPIV